MTTVDELDEGELIRRITAVLPVGDRTLIGSGDDCAQVETPEGSFIVTTDMLVQGEHFLTEWSSADEIGARAAAQNLADVAGMGGLPSALVVSMSVPGGTDADWLVSLAAGLGERARQMRAGVVGGDLTAGDNLVVSVTVMGYCPLGPVRRDGARPGDTIAVAGTLGHSAAGLALLSGGAVNPAEHDAAVLSDVADFVRVYRAPEPPLEAGVVAARHGARAMMDISDGLAMDAGRMAAASGVRIDLDAAVLQREADVLAPAAARLRTAGARVGGPVDADLDSGVGAGADTGTEAGVEAGTGADPLKWVCYGGEDHSLLAAFPPHVLVPTPFRPIGVATALEPGGQPRVMVDGAEIHGGWDHFGG